MSESAATLLNAIRFGVYFFSLVDERITLKVDDDIETQSKATKACYAPHKS